MLLTPYGAVAKWFRCVSLFNAPLTLRRIVTVLFQRNKNIGLDCIPVEVRVTLHIFFHKVKLILKEYELNVYPTLEPTLKKKKIGV